MSEDTDGVTVKLVDAILLLTASVEATITVPKACVVSKINEFAVTAELLTTVVAVPPRTNVPAEQVADDVAGMTNLLPAVDITRFPLVAVMAPKVAVKVVVVVKDPVTAVFPVAFPIFTAPVPPVPIVVTAAPELLIVVVPVIAAPPEETVRPPAVTVAPPEVTVSAPLVVSVPVTAVFPVALPILTAPVPPVPIEVVAAPVVLMVVVPVIAAPPAVTVSPVAAVIVVVEAIEPGAMKALGIDHVKVLPEPVTVIWLAVPFVLILPPVGPMAPPVSPVNVATSPVPAVSEIVSVDPDPVTEMTPEPTILRFPAEGVSAPPLLPVRVFNAPPVVPNNVQFALRVPPVEESEVIVYSAFPR